MIQTIKRLLASMLVMALSTITVQAAEPLAELQIKNLKRPSQQVWASGQPTKTQIKQLAGAGITHVINLRPKAETDWQEARLVESQGIVYHHLPIAGAAGVTFENAAKFDKLLSSLNGEPVLVHCASGNRVGGLVALQAIAGGETEQAAIEKGRAWGLTRLEARVRQLASASKEEQEACQKSAC